MICPECKKEVKRLELHHDPPRSKKYKEKDNWYYIDRDGNHKSLTKLNNRSLCRSCHRKADKEWGLPNAKQKLTKEQRAAKRKLVAKRILRRSQIKQKRAIILYNQLEAINKNLIKTKGSSSNG